MVSLNCKYFYLIIEYPFYEILYVQITGCLLATRFTRLFFNFRNIRNTNNIHELFFFSFWQLAMIIINYYNFFSILHCCFICEINWHCCKWKCIYDGMYLMWCICVFVVVEYFRFQLYWKKMDNWWSRFVVIWWFIHRLITAGATSLWVMARFQLALYYSLGEGLGNNLMLCFKMNRHFFRLKIALITN